MSTKNSRRSRQANDTVAAQVATDVAEVAEVAEVATEVETQLADPASLPGDTPSGDLLDGSGVVAIDQIFWLPYLNYRDSQHIRSHKPVTLVTKTGDDNGDRDSARTWRNMVDNAGQGRQPWSTSHPINVARADEVFQHGHITVAHLESEFASWAKDDPRRALYPQGVANVRYIGISGHCRQRTVGDVVAYTGFASPVVVPVTVNRIASILDFYQIQQRDNEEVGVGQRKTSTIEQLRALFRCKDAGALVVTRTDIERLLGVKTGIAQTLLACLTVAEILAAKDSDGRVMPTDGRSRLLLGAPAKVEEAKVYSPEGYIPAQKIPTTWLNTGSRGGKRGLLADYLDAKDALRAAGGAAPEVRQALKAQVAQAREMAIPVVEGEISKLVRGIANEPKISGKDDWLAIVASSPEGCVIFDLARAVLQGKLLEYREANAALLHCTASELSACIPAGA